MYSTFLTFAELSVHNIKSFQSDSFWPDVALNFFVLFCCFNRCLYMPASPLNFLSWPPADWVHLISFVAMSLVVLVGVLWANWGLWLHVRGKKKKDDDIGWPRGAERTVAVETVHLWSLMSVLFGYLHLLFTVLGNGLDCKNIPLCITVFLKADLWIWTLYRIAVFLL